MGKHYVTSERFDLLSILDYHKDMKRVFISFDYDHDKDLKELLIGQSKNEDSPFEITDWSIKEEVSGDWKKEARTRIKNADVVAVICGKHTGTAAGVNIEVEIAQEEGVAYFLLTGRKDSGNKKPNAAKDADKLHKWTWDNLKKSIGDAR